MKEKTGLVSIIMAAYNAGNTINTAIDSVLAQTYMDWELLVVDDCSTDQTAGIAAAYKDRRIRLLQNSKNMGVSRSRERGLRAAQGEWIAVLDSDDAWEKEKLQKQISLAQSRSADLIFTGSAFMDNDGNRLDWRLHVPETIEYRSLLKQNLISNSSVLVKTSLYRRFYAVGDNMHEDFAIWLKILKEGRTAFGIDEPLLIYRLAQSSKSSNKINAARMNWNTYRYVGLTPAEAAYYMCWYTIRGLKKYRHLK